MNDPAVIDEVLAMRTWAVVGATDVTHKPSCFVPQSTTPPPNGPGGPGSSS